MEDSTKSNTDSGIELTEEGQELIQLFIVLDSAHHEDNKIPFYDQLYEIQKQWYLGMRQKSTLPIIILSLLCLRKQ